MKRIFLFLIGTFLGCAVSPLNGQDLKPRGQHPRLFFTPEVIAKLKERIKTEPTTAQAWSAMLANAKSIEEFSLAYRMTGEKRFADKARGALGGLQWSDNMLLKRDPPWHAGLGTARSCYEAAVAFDSIYDALTPEERTTLAKRMVDRGIQPTLDDWVQGGKRIHALDSMGHNWWSACVFGAGMAALAVMDEEPRAKDWLNRISDGSLEWLRFAGSLLDNKPKSFDEGGGFYEDVNYASFAVSQYLLFRLAWNNALAVPALPEISMLDKFGDYFINVSYRNSGKLLNFDFGDGGRSANVVEPMHLLWANGYRKPRHLWLLNEAQAADRRAGQNRTTPFGLVFGPGESELAAGPAVPDMPLSALYGDIGWASLRSSWDRNATLLGVKSGYTWNHSHADAGSFLLFHRGEYLLIDSGKCTYGRPEYDGYYRQSQAHNVVLLIIDDLKTFVPGKFEWLLHVDGTAKQSGWDLEVARGESRVLVRPLFPAQFPIEGYPADFPENMRLVEKTGLKDREPDTKVPYYAFAAPEPSRRAKFLTAVLLVNGKDQADLPQLERLEGPDYIGVRVRQSGTTTDVYLNLRADGSIMHRNGNLKVNGWETDTYLTAITFLDGHDMTDPDAASRYFIAQGSYLRREDKVGLDSLSKVFLMAERTASGLNVLLQGQPVINAYLRSARPPETLMVNNVRRDAPYDEATKMVKISANQGTIRQTKP